MDKEFDLIIIGAGPAGLTAAVYASRYLLNTLVIGSLPGGLISEASEIQNFPTHNKITGMELAEKMIKQVEKLGVKIKYEQVIKIKNKFIVETDSGEYKAKKIIIATGTSRRKLKIPGEKKFSGKGVSYCATCDAAFYRNKTVSVIGGSDAALTAALLLARYAKKVYIIYRKDKFFRSEPAWVKQVEKTKNIEVIFNSEVKEILGTEKVEKLTLTKGELMVDGVFIEIGSIPEELFSKQLKLKTKQGYIIVDKKQRTNVKGVFAAGDVTDNILKQAITACGEGAIAANSAYEELR